MLLLLLLFSLLGVPTRPPRQFRGVPANPGPEPMGSFWICRGQRVVLWLLVLLLLVVVVVAVLLVA